MNRIASIIVGLALVLGTTGCPKEPTLAPESRVDCEGACKHATDMTCSLGTPSCVDNCRSNDEQGLPWPTGCMIAASDCQKLESCE
jgi:hypothetical protein